MEGTKTAALILDRTTFVSVFFCWIIQHKTLLINYRSKLYAKTFAYTDVCDSCSSLVTFHLVFETKEGESTVSSSFWSYVSLWYRVAVSPSTVKTWPWGYAGFKQHQKIDTVTSKIVINHFQLVCSIYLIPHSERALLCLRPGVTAALCLLEICSVNEHALTDIICEWSTLLSFLLYSAVSLTWLMLSRVVLMKIYF